MAEEEVEKEKESFSEGEKEEDTESDEDRRALVKQLKTCHERLKGLSTNDGHWRWTGTSDLKGKPSFVMFISSRERLAERFINYFWVVKAKCMCDRMK